MVKIIECPRDAMQGIKEFIPTSLKIEYINCLLKVGFDTIDCGSFVSPRHIPQMRDTPEVIQNLDLDNTDTKLSVIVANLRGAKDACQFPQIDYLGYPFSISETFQLRNTNSDMNKALVTVTDIMNICEQNGKDFVAYLSMAFGNPYGDEWSIEIAERWVGELDKLGIKYISLSDTIGVAEPDVITYFFRNLTVAFKNVEFGAHFHTTPNTWKEKVEAAYQNGCKRFDGAIRGYGGCPMAKDKLTGNMPTENLAEYFSQLHEDDGLKLKQFDKAMEMAAKVFP